MRLLQSAIGAVLLIVSAYSSAATLTFEYRFGENVFSGAVVGTLQADNDTFFVTQAIELTLNGVTLDHSDSYVGVSGNLNDITVPIDPTVNGIGILSLSGDLIDLTICDRELCVFGTIIVNGMTSSSDFFAASMPPDTLFFEGFFNENNWTAEIVVPLPATGWLFLGALATLGRLGHRKTLRP